MRVAVLVIVACGCERVSLEPPSGSAIDAPVDSRIGDGSAQRDSTAIDTGVLDPTLVAHYTMDGIVSGTLKDSSGHGNPGACASNTCPAAERGVIGQALLFDGAHDLITIPDSSSLMTTTGLTIASWINTVPISDEDYHCFLNKQFGSAGNDSWQVCLDSNQQVAVGIEDLSGTAVNVLSTKVAANTWVHVAAVWTGTEEQLFVNGAMAGSAALTGIMLDNGELSLGADVDRSGPVAYLSGSLDDVRIYNRGLSASEIGVLATPP